ncbi:vitamin B12-dependent ribonucleotide reductase [Candidatus Woesearchaeota archaeon]|nr:vitamin B12-dependent ribonucleotide reductase [Candidatus Woesearchaeota archaeon]
MTEDYEGLVFERRFSTTDNIKIQYRPELRDAQVKDNDGNPLTLPGIEVPNTWSQHALNITATHYLRKADVPETGSEKSVYGMATRISRTVREWGVQQGYFDAKNGETFERELAAILLGQQASFNSPVYYNVGLEARYGIDHDDTGLWGIVDGKAEPTGRAYRNPLVSACYIYNPDDSLEGLVNVMAVDSTTIFKYGAGIGCAWDDVREVGAPIKGGGYASGPLSFISGQNSIAGGIKSGGRTRRAAIMTILGVEHPDIQDFVVAKAVSEMKMGALIHAGSTADWEGHTVQDSPFQNINMSVGLTGKFFEAKDRGDTIKLRSVVDREKIVKEVDPNTLLDLIAYCAWECGDPGVQYRDNINAMNTCANDGLIIASNPCSEFLFQNESACNLASLNLLKFVDEAGHFDVDSFRAAVRVMHTAQEILVSKAGYPTENIANNSHNYRPLGLGYANLGALVMTLGLPYDSDDARNLAAGITSLMTSEAYLQSTRNAEVVGAFGYYDRNKDSVKSVLGKHRASSKRLRSGNGLEEIVRAANQNWDEVLDRIDKTGVRNAQVTLLPPTGTTAFMMDCDTLGIEPDISLVKYKILSGKQGTMKIVNQSVPRALSRLGYNSREIDEIQAYISEHGNLEGCKAIKREDKPVFDCSISSGIRTISPEGHLMMMAAVQPFLSGGISKTVNLPNDTRPDEIRRLYEMGHDLGLKALAVFRDGCKVAQPVNVQRNGGVDELGRGEKHKPNAKRQSTTFEYMVAGNQLFFTVGLYDNGEPAEIFVNVMDRGTEIDGAYNTIARMGSNMLQGGQPLSRVVRIFETSGRSHDYGGFTNHPFIKTAGGILPFIGQVLRAEFLGDISFVPPELRPLPEELEVYKRQPALHLIPEIGGRKVYPGSPSLEETIEKISEINYWKDEGQTTFETLEKIRAGRKQKTQKTGGQEQKGRMTGRTCSCGSPLIQNGSCTICSNPTCNKREGGCGA